MFVKYRIGTGAYQHTWLNNTGHVNPTGSTIAAGLLDPALPYNQTTNPGIGVFIYRDANGTGTFSKTGVQLRWNYGANGVADNAIIDIRVYAIENVYVPQGSFYAGSGGTESNAFYKYPATTNPYQITSEGAITVGTAADNLYYVGSYATTNPFVACNFISWADLAAYLDWSGLRPMTELEFEKSCRGILPAVPTEYAWGTTGFASSEYTLNNSGLTNENIAANYSTSLGNAANAYTTHYSGPVRVGIFAGNGLNTGRVTSGATYYGIMEMSGNLWERPVTVGNPTGRGFTGANGNGLLSATGDADASNWPGINAEGAGLRGGFWDYNETGLQVSDRLSAAYADNSRHGGFGGRGVRTAP